jgi:hypothetical protein
MTNPLLPRRSNLPFSLEFIASMVARLLYHVRTSGAENMPKTGGVLLIAQPVRVMADFRFPRLKGHYTKAGALKGGAPDVHTRKPDIDKIHLFGMKLYKLLDEYPQIAAGARASVFMKDRKEELIGIARVMSDFTFPKRGSR